MTDTVGTRSRDWWTIGDLSELPDSGARYELVDGALLVSPAPSPHHGKSMHLLRRLLDRQAPEELAVSSDVEIKLAATTPTSFQTWSSFR